MPSQAEPVTQTLTLPKSTDDALSRLASKYGFSHAQVYALAVTYAATHFGFSLFLKSAHDGIFLPIARQAGILRQPETKDGVG